jgi:hypothetical protein
VRQFLLFHKLNSVSNIALPALRVRVATRCWFNQRNLTGGKIFVSNSRTPYMNSSLRPLLRNASKLLCPEVHCQTPSTFPMKFPRGSAATDQFTGPFIPQYRFMLSNTLLIVEDRLLPPIAFIALFSVVAEAFMRLWERIVTIRDALPFSTAALVVNGAMILAASNQAR